MDISRVLHEIRTNFIKTVGIHILPHINELSIVDNWNDEETGKYIKIRLNKGPELSKEDLNNILSMYLRNLKVHNDCIDLYFYIYDVQGSVKLSDWRNWADCPYCKKGHLEYNDYAAGGENLTVFYKCSRCGKETSRTVEWESIAETILEE